TIRVLQAPLIHLAPKRALRLHPVASHRRISKCQTSARPLTTYGRSLLGFVIRRRQGHDLLGRRLHSCPRQVVELCVTSEWPLCAKALNRLRDSLPPDGARWRALSRGENPR